MHIAREPFLENKVFGIMAAGLAPGRDLMSRESANASRVSRLNGTLLKVTGVTASRCAEKSAYRGDMCTGRGAVVSFAARQIIGDMHDCFGVSLALQHHGMLRRPAHDGSECLTTQLVREVHAASSEALRGWGSDRAFPVARPSR